MATVRSSKKSTSGRVVSTPSNLRRIVRDIVDSRVEHKRLASTVASTDILTAGVIIPISGNVFQGDDIGQRSGDVITPKMLTFRLLAQASTATFTSFSVRCIIFQDTINNGALPAVTDVLNTASPTSVYNSVNAQQNRFKICYDKVFAVVGQTSATRVNIVKFIPMKGKIHYIATTGNTAGSGKNALFALFITENSQAGITIYNWAWSLEYLDA